MSEKFDWYDDMHSMQVVMSYDSSNSYRFRFQPGFVNKKYLNKYVLNGSSDKYQGDKEIYIDCRKENFTDSGKLIGDEIYELFKEKGVDDTFRSLDAVLQTARDEYLESYNLWKMHRQFEGYSFYNTDYTDMIMEPIHKKINLALFDLEHAEEPRLPKYLEGITYTLFDLQTCMLGPRFYIGYKKK